MDVLTYALFTLLLFGGAIGGFAVGKYQDIVFRCNFYIRWLKQNAAILERVSKDNKTRTHRLINLDNDEFNVGVLTWLVKKGRIYRKFKEESGFKVTRSNLKWEQGVPIITVDDETIKPLDFYPEEGHIRPEELGSTVNAWVMNQIAKGMASLRANDLWIKLTAIGVLICIIGLYVVINDIGKLPTSCGAAPSPTTSTGASGTVTPQAGTTTTANGTTTIKAPGVT